MRDFMRSYAIRPKITIQRKIVEKVRKINALKEF